MLTALLALLLASPPLEGLASMYSPDDYLYGGTPFVGCPAAAHRIAPSCCEGRTGHTGRWQGRCLLTCVREAMAAKGLAVVAMRPGDARCGQRMEVCNARVESRSSVRTLRDVPNPDTGAGNIHGAAGRRGDRVDHADSNSISTRPRLRFCVNAIVLDRGTFGQRNVATGKVHVFLADTGRRRDSHEWNSVIDLAPATYRYLLGSGTGRLHVRIWRTR